ncbi:MAG: excinuclease ABC subunit UvrC [Clostridia bacterium]|jgi:excinuclease ABC subunit C|nr:excinuclease ABC subunit UvrC [Clostridia bacterium]
MSTGNTIIQKKLEHLPAKPGVYLMLNEEGNVIYVGKASSLRNRVRSYFRSTGKQSPKVQALVNHIADFEYIVTDSEVEALILECNLIKEHRPKYNISLRDDKHYPYLKLTLTHDYPRLVVVRSMKKDGNRYFGPYTQVGALNDTIKLLRRLFPLRTCTDSTLARQPRPCLNHHIGRCLAPCKEEVTKEAYQEVVKEVILFLEGKQEDLLRRLKEKMEQAAEELQFEKAAEYRDQIKSVEQVLEKQKIIFAGQQSYDVIAFARGMGEACVQIFFIREGKLIGRNHFFLEGTDDLSRGAIMTAFLKQYYSQAETIPREILLAEVPEEKELLEAWLTGLNGRKVSLKVPRRGEKLQLVEMVAQNALTVLEEEELLRRKKNMLTTEAVLELQRELDLGKPPFRIEGFDISHIQGSMTVASMVVFENGAEKPSDYRRFRIKSVEGPDDYQAMREVVTRRFKHLAKIQAEGTAQEKFAAIPDLILIDGGKGQLNAARELLAEYGLSHIPTFGLAEKEETLFREGDPNPIKLPSNSPALYLVQRVRDEAHRFALTYHRDLRSKDLLHSKLDDVPGVGPKRKKALLRKFGSVARIREASIEELLAVEGINEKVAQAIKDFL